MVTRRHLAARLRLLRTAGRILAVASIYLVTPLLAHAGGPNQASFSGAEGFAYAISSNNPCINGAFNIDVSAKGTASLSPPSVIPFVLVEIFVYDNCKGTSYFEYGSTNTLQFSAVTGNGTDLPKSITASGQIPLTDAYSGGSDTASFQITLTPAAGQFSYDQSATSQQTYTYGPVPVTTYEHFDGNFSLASVVSLSISTRNLGTLPASSVYYSNISSTRSHTVNITH